MITKFTSKKDGLAVGSHSSSFISEIYLNTMNLITY
jgi:hypothetical protein